MVVATQVKVSGAKKTVSDDVTLFVAPTGSDETGKGTEQDPFASADYAVQWANANIDFSEQFDLFVKLAPGTYDAIQIYGHDARQVYLVGEPGNPAAIKVRVIRELAVYALTVSYYSFVHVVGMDIAAANVTGFSHLAINDCQLTPSDAHELLSANNHSTLDFNSGLVKAGRIGGTRDLGICYDAQVHSHMEVGDVEYEAYVDCATFCSARFLSAVFVTEEPDTKENIRAEQTLRSITQSIVCDTDFLPEGETASLVGSGGIASDLSDSDL